MAHRPLDIAQGFRGVNRREDQQAMRADELYTAQNLYPASRGVAETRLGATRFNGTVYSGVTAGRNIIRFYPSGETARKIIAMNHATADILAYGDDSALTLTEITGGTALSATKQWLLTVYQGNLYAGNAAEVIQKIANGTTRADIGGSPQMPACYPGGPYRYRLLGFGNSTQPKRLYYTDTFSENCDANDHYLTIEHPENISAVGVFGRDEDRGIFGDLLICTPTSMWTLRGDFGNLDDFDQMSPRLGCPSPLTLCNTPYGLIGLGYDGSTDLVVFMIPTTGGRPIVISDAIRTSEALPRAYRHLASAVYHKGFYRLSFVPASGTTPTRQWWADLRFVEFDRPNLNIGWWGPMSGQTIGAFAIQDQASDTDQLIAADGAAGYVNLLDPAGTYTDFDTAYTAILETKALDGKNPAYNKTFDGCLVGALATQAETLSVNMKVDEGAVALTQELAIAYTSPTVGETTLVGDSTIVGGTYFDEFLNSLARPLYGRRASVQIQYKGGRRVALKRIIPIGSVTRRLQP